ncbi:MAG: hypothetical protein ABIP79_11620 [Chitinophagaceae bacterium]
MQNGPVNITEASFNSRLCFKPLVMALKKNIAEGNPGMKKLYGQVIAQFEAHPELLNSFTDTSTVKPHSELIEELLSAVFPPTTSNYMYGMLMPFKNEAVYVSPLFQELLIKPGTNQVEIPRSPATEENNFENIHFAYGLILKKYLGYNSPVTNRSVYSVPDPSTGLLKYMEIRLDARFIDVNPVAEMPEMPASIVDPNTNRILTVSELSQLIPLDKFVFEGVAVVRINDMTEQEVITKMKNRLLESSLSDEDIYIDLEEQIQSLIELQNITIGVTPFFKINGHYVYSDIHNANSLLFKKFDASGDKDEISDYCKLLFRENDQPLLFENIEGSILTEVQSLRYYHLAGARSLILCPLKSEKELIGILEIFSDEPGYLKPQHLSKIENAIPLFTLGLEKSLEQLNSHVESIIKKKFTAVQPSVEWKFTETSLNYLVSLHKKQDAYIERIAFGNVHPLYSAIDIRNSSTERSKSIKADLVEQLHLAKKTVTNIQSVVTFPLLQEVEFKIEKYIAAVSDILQSEEEILIHDFFIGEVAAVFNHLKNTEPEVKKDIEEYFAALDPDTGMRYNNRKEYEQSITRINETLSRFIDKEQSAAQKVYPHYFERFVTDGVEFNIYMGQSITPRKKFDEIYLRNLRMWQLNLLAKAAIVTHKLEAELTNKLRTTQLILSHSQPLAILFRTEERKFDVDGAYNIRYEIVKKRIDKVRVKETNERLTQPGKIAIVYSHTKEAEEYIGYIEFLQNKNLLKSGIEKFDLEELQGVSGLKALRVDVNFDDVSLADKKIKLPEITVEQLPGN